MGGRTAGRRALRARALAAGLVAAGLVAAGLALGGPGGTALAATGTTTPPPTPATTPTGAPVVTARPPACANAIQVVVGTATSAPTPIATSSSTVGGARLAAPGLQVSTPPGTPPPPVVPAAGWVVADMTSGNVIASCNAHAQFMPASTMKILTALALETKVDPRSTYVALPADAQIDGTKVGLSPGSTYTGDDLWHGLLMSSGNDAAHALADLSGGPTVAAELMSAEARRLGALDTVPVNTSGLDAPGQVTSAYDLALLGRELLARPYLARVVATRTYSFPGKGLGNGRARPRFQIQSHNRLLGTYPGTTGVKNGYTVQAGGSFVGSATRAGRSYVVTVLRADGRTSDMAKQLLDWAFVSGSSAAPVGRLVTAQEVAAGTAGSGPGVAPAPTTAPVTTQTLPAGPTSVPVYTPGPTSTIAGGPAAGRTSSTADAWAAGVVLGAVAAFGLVSAVLVLRRARLHRAGSDADVTPGLLSRRLGGPPRVSGSRTKDGDAPDDASTPVGAGTDDAARDDDAPAAGSAAGADPAGEDASDDGDDAVATVDDTNEDGSGSDGATAAPTEPAAKDTAKDTAQDTAKDAADGTVSDGPAVPAPTGRPRALWGRRRETPPVTWPDDGPATAAFPELAGAGLGSGTPTPRPADATPDGAPADPPDPAAPSR